MEAHGSAITPQVLVSSPVVEFTKMAASCTPSIPSQLASTSSPAGSGAPGKIEASLSSQSERVSNPSRSRSGGGAVVVVVVLVVVVGPGGGGGTHAMATATIAPSATIR